MKSCNQTGDFDPGHRARHLQGFIYPTKGIERRKHPMTQIQLTHAFTTDERDGDTVSIALALSDEADELWRRAFDELITNHEWLGGNDGVILGYSFPFSYEGTNQVEIRTHTSTIDQALDAVSRTVDKVNAERLDASIHNVKNGGTSEGKVQAWFDRL